MFEKLFQGNKLFRDTYFRENKEEFLKLAKDGQEPKILFISCSDSRVIPNLITSTKPGELFEVRNVGNFIPPYEIDDDYHGTASAIEYAVSVLEVEHIIVCGHSNCGACESLHKNLKGIDELRFTRKWLKLGESAKDLALKITPEGDRELLLRNTEKLSVAFQIDNLLTYPIVKSLYEQKKLSIYGWYYRIENGSIECLDLETREFKDCEDLKL